MERMLTGNVWQTKESRVRPAGAGKRLTLESVSGESSRLQGAEGRREIQSLEWEGEAVTHPSRR